MFELMFRLLFILAIVLFVVYLSFMRTRVWFEVYRLFFIFLFLLLLQPYFLVISGELSNPLFLVLGGFSLLLVDFFILFQLKKRKVIGFLQLIFISLFVFSWVILSHLVLSLPLFVISMISYFVLLLFAIVSFSFWRRFPRLTNTASEIYPHVFLVIGVSGVLFLWIPNVRVQLVLSLVFYAVWVIFLIYQILTKIYNPSYFDPKDRIVLMKFLLVYPVLILLVILLFIFRSSDFLSFRTFLFSSFFVYTFLILLHIQGKVKIGNVSQFIHDFFKTFSESQDGVLLIQDRQVLQANMSAQNLFIYTKSEFVGMQVDDLFEPNILLTNVSELMQENPDFREELVARTKGAGRFETLVSGVSLSEDYSILTVRDIRSYAGEIRNSQLLNEVFQILMWEGKGIEESLKNVVTVIQDFYYQCDVFIYREDESGLIGTREPENGLEEEIRDFFETSKRELVYEIGKTQARVLFSIRIEQQNYGVLCVEARKQNFTTQYRTYFKFVANAIAQFFRHKELLMDLETANRKYSTVLDSSLSGVYLIQDGVFKYINQAFIDLLGYSIEELMTMKQLLRLVRKEYRNVIVNDLRNLLEGKESFITDSIKLYKKNGEEIWGAYNAVIIDYEGRPAILGYMMDITTEVEMGKQEEKMVKMMVNEQKMKTLKYLVSGIAHEFNNLFTIVKGTVELMKYGMDESNPMVPQLNVIGGAVDRGVAITNRMRVFVRHDTMNIQMIFLENFFQNSLTLFQSRISKSGKKIDLNYKVDPAAPYILADEFSMEEILFNLIENSVAAIVEAGKIEIRVWIRKNGQIEIEVVDDGEGIPQGNIGKVFDPFFTTRSPNEGTGLGLFIVYQLMDAMKGSVHIEALSKHGTRVSLLFPPYEKKSV